MDLDLDNPSFTHIVQESKNALSIMRMFHFSMYTKIVIGLQGHCHYMHYVRALASTNYTFRQYVDFQRSYQIFLIIMKKKKKKNHLIEKNASISPIEKTICI
jgi:hypothetical protein